MDTVNLKLVIIGDSGTGKSSLLLRFTNDTFDPEVSSTIGVDFKVKTIVLDNKRVKLSIWDTAGQERFRTLTPSYYRGAQGVILVYDVSSRESFEGLERWLNELDTYATKKDLVTMLVGNKIDKTSERQVSRSDGIQFIKQSTLNLIGLDGLSMKDVGKVQRAAWESRAQWYNIGLELEMDPGTLDAIKANDEDIEGRFRAMLTTWLKMVQPKPTLAALAEALQSPTVGFGHLAERIQALARRNSMLFIEASAKTKDGVQEAFEELVHKVLQTPSLYTTDSPNTGSFNVGAQASRASGEGGWGCGC